MLADQRKQIILDQVNLNHSVTVARLVELLGVSTETVRWHLKNIFAKLSVFRRQEAIVVARSMGIPAEPLSRAA